MSQAMVRLLVLSLFKYGDHDAMPTMRLLKRQALCHRVTLTAALIAACSRSYERREPDATIIVADATTDRTIAHDQSRDGVADTATDIPTVLDVRSLCTSRRECDDGLFCNGSEDCVAGRCVVRAPPNCDDRVTCTLDRCDENSASCLSLANPRLCASGQTCDPVRGCIGGGCSSDQSCDDGVYCNGFERCLAGACTAGSPRICDDNNRCTENLCHETSRACQFIRTDIDGDGFSPQTCGADDCNDSNPNVRPGVMEECADRIDNNCNGLVDCNEPSCASLPACCRPMGRERCDNGVDDNCNGQVDCADRMCRFLPRCRNVDGGVPSP